MEASLAAVTEIGGAWLVWQGCVSTGVRYGWRPGWVALGAYGVVAAFQPDRWDFTAAAICLLGAVIIMYVPRPA